ncbi:CID/ENTH/VHS domain containing protein [Cryptosporidium felis]|nr:CID/ENTH/VHS domain containing protein [Cryptosporidium felis]
MSNFDSWLENSRDDPLAWIWLEVKDLLAQNDDFATRYSLYLDEILKNKNGYSDQFSEFLSPLESLYCELNCIKMPEGSEANLKKLLDSLKPKRQKIKEIMIFAINNSDKHSVQVLELLFRKFPLSTYETKLSILYCISDILYNSHSLKMGAWKLRNCIMGLFPYLVSHIAFNNEMGNSFYLNLVSKTQDIIDLWFEWKIFPSEYIKGISSTLHFDHKFQEMSKKCQIKLTSCFNGNNIDDGALLDGYILSVLSIWPLRSRRPTWRTWREINDLLIQKNLHESKLRRDWISNNGVIFPPIKSYGLSNFLHRISFLSIFNYPITPSK